MIIKFSNFYEKMPPLMDNTILRGVEVVNLEDLDPVFLEKDTAIVGGGHYPLPKKGKYMILKLESAIEYELDPPLKGGGMQLWAWQTIRRWTPKKEGYYRAHIGKAVDCVVVE